MQTINLDRRWVKLVLVLLIIFSICALFAILTITAGCGAEIRPIQNHQPTAPCCSASSCERMHR